MAVTQKGLAVIRSFEGRALKAYRDSVGVITIGYGNTNYDKFAVEYLGGPIKLGMSITDAQADELLIKSLAANYYPAVVKAMPGASLVELDGGASFHYNTGAIGRASWVKAWAKKTPFYASIMSWNKAGGKVLAGLTRRRNREYAIISKGDYGPEGRTAPVTLDSSGRIINKAAKPIPVTDAAHPLNNTPGMLSLGSRGPEVLDYNNALLLIGHRVNKSDTFDSATEKATRAFQSAHKQLTVDGVAGPATRAAVNRERDARTAVTKTVATGTGLEAAVGGADGFAGLHLPLSVYVAVGVVALIAVCYWAWTYRDEFTALAARGGD